ncbi:MAG: tetratricopeptide repeat protein [Candidatus Hodarchaeales archaeon]
MTPPHEIYQLQSNLTMVFDRIGLTQELNVNEVYDDFSSSEIDKISFLIEKFQLLFENLIAEGPIPNGIIDHRLLVCLGNYSYSQDDSDHALEWYNHSNAVEENEWAYYNSAKIYIIEDNFDLGYQAFDQAIKLKPDFLKAILGQARILLKQGKKEEALLKLEKGQKINPNDQGINKLFAEFFIEKGEKKEALIHLKAIHHKDQETTEKIQDLEYDNSLIGRIRNIFQRK